MTISETPEQVVATGFRLSWGPVIAGAIAAAALAFVLNSFGLAIGLAISSASPTWRDTSFAIVLLSGLYLVLVALASYGLGGYIAGRMQRRSDATEFPEFQDGMHGIVVWGIATLLAGILAAVSLPLLSRTPGVAAATPNATTSVPGESLIAYELDRLFRGSERRTGGDLSYDRAEAARILLTTSSHSGMDPQIAVTWLNSSRPIPERLPPMPSVTWMKWLLAQSRTSAVPVAVQSFWRSWPAPQRCLERSRLGRPQLPAGRTATDVKPFLPYGIGAEHPKFGVRSPPRQGKSAKPIHSAPTLKGKSTLLQLAEVLVFDAIPLVGHRDTGTSGYALALLSHSNITNTNEETKMATTVDLRRETASLIGSDKVEGTTVYGGDNQKIGSVQRIMIDKVSGKVAYAVISFGGFLGMGEDYYPLPWANLKYDNNLGGYRVGVTESQLKGAPKFNRNTDWDWSDRNRDKAVYDYYDTPLWY